METKEQLTTEFNKRFKRGKYWDITICWNKGDYPLVIGSSVESVKDDIINFTIEQMSLQKQEIVEEIKGKIHISNVENTANIKIMSECCDAEVYISGGGYDGEDIVPISECCSKCGKSFPKTYNLDSKSGKRVSYIGVEIPF